MLMQGRSNRLNRAIVGRPEAKQNSSPTRCWGKDAKFKKTARKMFQEANHGARSIDDSKEICEIVEVPNCGHAVHLENPLPLIRAARRFLNKPKGVLISEPGLLYTDLCQRSSRKDCYKGETSLSKVSDFDFVTL